MIWHVFHNNEYVGGFPTFYKLQEADPPATSRVYDRATRSWWLMDRTPLHIDSVPKEMRAMALLLGIA